jgi:hypothetical protein
LICIEAGKCLAGGPFLESDKVTGVQGIVAASHKNKIRIHETPGGNDHAFREFSDSPVSYFRDLAIHFKTFVFERYVTAFRLYSEINEYNHEGNHNKGYKYVFFHVVLPGIR